MCLRLGVLRGLVSPKDSYDRRKTTLYRMDLDRAIATLKSCQIIPEEDVKNLCNKAKEILMEEQNVHHVPIPATVVGDIHGQFYDLLELFDVGGQVSLCCKGSRVPAMTAVVPL